MGNKSNREEITDNDHHENSSKWASTELQHRLKDMQNRIGKLYLELQKDTLMHKILLDEWSKYLNLIIIQIRAQQTICPRRTKIYQEYNSYRDFPNPGKLLDWKRN